MTNPNVQRQVSEADAFLMGGGGGKWFSFKNIGDFIEGTVLDMSVRQKNKFGTQVPDFYDNGDPKMELVISLQTSLRDPAVEGDDGKRQYGCLPGLKAAIAKAVKDSGRRTVGDGSYLKASYVRDVPGKGSMPKKEFAVVYTPAADVALSGTPAPAAAPTPPPAAPPAPAAAAAPGLVMTPELQALMLANPGLLGQLATGTAQQ